MKSMSWKHPTIIDTAIEIPGHLYHEVSNLLEQHGGRKTQYQRSVGTPAVMASRLGEFVTYQVLPLFARMFGEPLVVGPAVTIEHLRAGGEIKAHVDKFSYTVVIFINSTYDTRGALLVDRDGYRWEFSPIVERAVFYDGLLLTHGVELTNEPRTTLEVTLVRPEHVMQAEAIEREAIPV